MKGFIGRIKSMVRKHAAGVGTFSGTRLAKFGRGGLAAAGIPVRSHPQRVTVKSRIVRHSRYSGPGGASAALAKHIDYLGRDGVAEEGDRGVVFDAQNDLSRDDAQVFRGAIVDDRHHFRFIVSPEAGSALDLKTYAREFVAHMESDLGTRIQWLGVAHFDTDNPHLHLLVRGKDSQGGDLVINREYMSHGMRLRAMELATQHLGPRLLEDIERSLKRDLAADRVTGLDLGLTQQASLHPEGWISALRKNDGSLAGERQRLNTLTRLQHLESLGLAREIQPGVWQTDIDLIQRLRSLSIRGDIIKLMHERMRGSDPGITTVIFNKDHPPTEPVVGRVYARGTADELTDAQYLLVEARDGRAYYVGLSEYSEVAGRQAGVGSIVRLTPAARQTGGAADRNIGRVASANGGIYDPVIHAVETERSSRLPQGVSAQDYIHSHLKRLQALSCRGFVEALGEDRFRIPADFETQIAAAPAHGRDHGNVTKVERLSAIDLDTQIRENGVTWLDHEIASGADVGAPVQVGASRFERQLASAINHRAEHLKSLGLGEEVGGEFRARGRFLDELYERELQDAARRLQSRYGDQVRLQEGANLKGRIEAIEQTPSGPHAIVAMPGRYALIPADAQLSQQIGRQVSLKIGRGLSFHPMGEGALKLSIRYQFLDLTRTRKLGR
jgi:type IV secretory pathway VirD2 relaxase